MGATPAMAEAIHHEISGSQLEIFEHASHLSPLEQPEKFQHAVSEFLNRL
jgi:pimeloyl-ACP methyl ester carboxylesterase